MERLDELQRWWLALSAIQVEAFGGSHTTLRMDDDAPGPWQEALRDSWDVTSPQSLLETLKWLLTSGHARDYEKYLGHLPFSWDIGRFSWVVRASVSAGFLIEESTAWELFEPITAPIVCAYNSWQGYAEDYLAARRIWLGDRIKDPETAAGQERYVQGVHRLLDPANKRSPWQQLDWATPAGYLVVQRRAAAAPEFAGHHERSDDFERLQNRVSDQIRHQRP
jgi:hypothetical protein